MENPILQDPEAPEQEPAVERLARDDHARRRFLKMVGGTGAAGALSLLVAACGSSGGSSSSQSGGGSSMPSSSGGGSSSSSGGMKGAKSDLAILNYALTLEYLESTFYKLVDQKKLFSGKDGDVVKSFGQEENQHVTALTQAIQQAGGKPVSKPTFTSAFTSLTKSKTTALKAAAMVENVGAAAYLGAATKIKSPQVLAAALSIHSVEARHAAVLNQVLGTGFKGSGPYVGVEPDGAFATGASMSQVLKIVKPFIKS